MKIKTCITCDRKEMILIRLQMQSVGWIQYDGFSCSHIMSCARRFYTQTSLHCTCILTGSCTLYRKRKNRWHTTGCSDVSVWHTRTTFKYLYKQKIEMACCLIYLNIISSLIIKNKIKKEKRILSSAKHTLTLPFSFLLLMFFSFWQIFRQEEISKPDILPGLADFFQFR